MLQRLGYVFAAAALVLPSTANGAPPPPSLPAAVAACVEANLPRYTTPSTAVLAQYISLVAACRAAVAHERDVEVTLTPLGGAAPGGAPGAKTGEAVGSAQAPARPPVTLPRTAPGPKRATGATTLPVQEPRAHAQGSVALARVRESLARRAPSGAPLPSFAGLSAAPAWLLWLVGALGIVSVSAGALRVWLRSR